MKGPKFKLERLAVRVIVVPVLIIVLSAGLNGQQASSSGQAIRGPVEWWESNTETGNWIPDVSVISSANYASGDWFGLRSGLEDHGIKLGGQWVGTFYGMVDGGLKQHGAFDEQLKLFAHVDFNELIGIPGLTGDIAFRYRDGRDPNNYAGASNTFDPSGWQGGKGWRLTPFYLTWKSGDMLFGVRNFLTVSGGWQDPYFFFGQDALANMFVNNAFTTKGAGSNGILFSSSYAAWGGYVKVKPINSYYLKAGLYAAYPNATHGTDHGFDFAGNAQNPGLNGLYFLTETAVMPEIGPDKLSGKYALGFIYWGVQNTGFGGQPYPGRYNFYWQGDQMLYRKPAGFQDGSASGILAKHGRSFYDDQGLYWFGWANYAPGVNDTLSFYFHTGLGYKGLVPTRDADEILFGLAYGNYSSELLNSEEQSGTAAQTFEGVLEGDYRVQLSRWGYIQPYVQYIFHPNGAGLVANVTVVGFTMGINF